MVDEVMKSRLSVLNERMDGLIGEGVSSELRTFLENTVPELADASNGVDDEVKRFLANVYTLGVTSVFDGDVNFDEGSYRFGSSDLLEAVSVALKSFAGLRDQHVLNKTNSVIFSEGTRLDNFSEYMSVGLEADVAHFEKVLSVLVEQKAEGNSEVNEVEERWNAFFETNSFIKNAIKSTVIDIIAVYELLFSKGFELEPNYAVFSLSESGLFKINPNSNNISVHKSVSFKKLNGVMASVSGVVEDKEHQQFNVAAILNSDKLVYFPLKMLEYASGRVTTENVEKGHYKDFDGGAGWKSYADKYVRGNLEKFLRRAVRLVMTKEFGEANVLDAIEDEDVIIANSELLERVFEKMYRSMTTCALVSSFEGDKDDWASIEIKVNSEFFAKGTPLVASKLIDKIIKEARSGKGTVDGTAYEIATEIVEGLGKQKVITYSHTFDPVLANARPLFSYQALDALIERGESISWDSVLMGKSIQGKMVISRNGEKINFREQLFHFLIAGSRSGKGVSTMAFLLAALKSAIPVFYLDKKPDISVILKTLAEMLGDDNMFLVNGSGYERQFDPKGVMDMNASHRKALWESRVPEFWGFKGNYHDTIMGDLVYYRAIMLCFGLLLLRFWAKSNDSALYEQLNGDRGVLIVIDEFTKWQKSFSSQYLNPRGVPTSLFGSENFIGEGEFKEYITAKKEIIELSKKGKLTARDESARDKAEEIVKAIESNPRRAYGTDLYRNMQRTFTELFEKKVAGFKGTEEVFSDVFIVGQDLDIGDLPNGETIYARNQGAGGKLTALSDYKNTCAVSSFMYNFSTDFILGYNADKPGYMRANMKSSVTNGRLTAAARNFAYIKSNRDMVINGDIEYINKNAVVYKPYLVLNEADEPNVNEGMSETEFISACSQPDNTQYVGGVAKAIGKEQYFKLRPQITDSKTGKLREDIGFKGYLDRLLEQDGAQISLSKSGNIADLIVNQMGYDGNWYQFLCDLRPEWNFSAVDVVEAFTDNAQFKEGKVRCDMFYRIENAKSKLVAGKDTSKNENSGVSSNFISEDDNLTEENAKPFESVPKSQFEEYKELELREQALAESEYGLESDIEGEDLSDMLSEDEVSDNEFEDDCDELVLSKIDNVDNAERRQAFNDIINTFGSAAFDKIDFADKPAGFGQDVIEARKAAVDFNADALKYEERGGISSTNKIEVFTEPFEVRRDTSENFMMDYYTLVNIMSDNVFKVFGGANNMESIRVISRKLVVNNSYFNAKVPVNMVKGLPKDRRSNVANSEFAELFDFRRLLQMPRLSLLEVSTIEFFETRVAMDLDVPVGYVGVVELFKKIPSLRYIIIEGRKYSRDLSQKDIVKAENFFKSAAKRSMVADTFYKNSRTWRKNSWDTTKELFKRRGFWNKIVGVGSLGVTVVSGSAEVGTKVARKAKKGFGDLLKAAFNLDD